MLIDENRVIERLQNQDPDALELVMSFYGKSVYSLVSRILYPFCSSEDIEECVSDVFVSAWDKSNEYNSGRGSLKTWLLILAKYKALDYKRKKTRELATIELKADAHAIICWSSEHLILGKETKDELLRAIDALEQLDKTIFYKRYFYYESHEQISKSLGLTVKAVESRLYRARNAVRANLFSNRQEELS